MGYCSSAGRIPSIDYERTDATRSSRYHRYFLLRAHDSPLSIEDAKVHSSRYKSSDLNLAAGCKRIVFRPLQDRVEPSTSSDIASGHERERERILQQTSQRESVIIAFHPHDPHEIRQHPYRRSRR